MSANDLTVAFIALAPFVAALLAPWIHRFTGHFAGWVLAIVPASIFVYLLGFIDEIAQGGLIATRLQWLPAYNIDLTFFIDGLSLTFGLLISGIGTLIVIYSGAYLKGHKHQGRFFSFILMFMGSMLGLVFADNMIVLYVFWELTSITSFLLIGFDAHRQAARRAAVQALVVTAGGGLVMLAGMILLQATFGTWELSQIRSVGNSWVEHATYLPVLILFLFGAFTKSAQVPFHFWLPNAMEAPTPVSAYLHSATMVKAGVYLLARMHPTLGGTYEWSIILTVFGSVTLLWGAANALKQTDLKQMLAQTTVASLGLLVLLLGLGTEAAISAAVVYLVAHSFFKGALFLVAGSIDHGTGSRELTELSGLRRALPFTFAATALGALSMCGLPPALGFLAKEEMYGALLFDWSFLLAYPHHLVVLLVLMAGNAMMFAVAAAIAIRPFFGPEIKTPLPAHEGSVGLWGGALLLGLLAIVAVIFADWAGHEFLVPTASAIYNFEVESHLYFNWKVWEWLVDPRFYLSLVTWAAGIAIFWRLDRIRTLLRRFREWLNWDFDVGFDWIIFSLVRISDAITRVWHHGRLELYLTVVFVMLAAALYLPLWLTGSLPAMPDFPELRFYEWAVMLLAAVGLLAVLTATTRLVAIVSLGIQGFGVALLFMLFGAPDLSFTQFMVEILSVVILALVMTRLHLDQRDNRVLEDMMRDGALALTCGAGITILMLAVLQTPLDTRLTDFFAETSVPIAHGHNIVNVILVDYRGLDTLGEISVVMTAGIAILALIGIRAGGPQTGIGAAPKTRIGRRSRSRVVA